MTNLTSPNELIELLRGRRFNTMALVNVSLDYINYHFEHECKLDFDEGIKISSRKGWLTIFMVNKCNFRVVGHGYHYDGKYRQDMTFDQLIMHLDEQEMLKSPLIKRATKI